MKIIYPFAFLLLFQFFSSCDQAEDLKQPSQASALPDSLQNKKTAKAGTANIVFRSADSGQTWQDISKGLPEPVKDDYGTVRNGFFADENGLWFTAENGIYHSNPTATSPFWKKELLLNEHSSTTAGKAGIFAYKYWGVNLKKTNGTSVWSPIFENSSEPRIRSVFETAGAAIFIGTDKGLFKTADSGKTWKHVYAGGWVGNMAESNGVLLSTSKRRIIRSTDNGENWALVMSEGAVTFDVKQIKGGFAAIIAGSSSSTRMLRRSYDGGKTWQAIDAGLQNKVVIDSIWRTWDDRPRVQAFTTSIIQVGEHFFCTHPDGIFKSSDKGKTWKLFLPSIKGKVFNLCVSGNMIYAILSNGGC